MFLSNKEKLKAALKYYCITLNSDGCIDETIYHHNTLASFKKYCISNNIQVNFINPPHVNPTILYKKDCLGVWYSSSI